MEIAVVGLGIIGGCLATLLRGLGYPVRQYDPNKGFKDGIRKSEIIFVCVPTEDIGLWHLREAVTYITSNNKRGIIAIRSTIPPGTTRRLQDKYTREFVYIPEFLRERTAMQDEVAPQYIIVGTESPKTFKLFKNIFKEIIPEDRIMMFTPVEAELAKIAANSFYLTKIVFSNELYDICERYGARYSRIFKLFELDRYTNPMHLQPLLDGYRGAGGKCLPKDTQFLINAAKNKGVVPHVIETAWNKNKQYLNGSLTDD